MDVAPRLLHHPLDVVATFANNVRVLCVGNIHLQSHSVTLMSKKKREVWVKCNIIEIEACSR